MKLSMTSPIRAAVSSGEEKSENTHPLFVSTNGESIGDATFVAADGAVGGDDKEDGDAAAAAAAVDVDVDVDVLAGVPSP